MFVDKVYYDRDICVNVKLLAVFVEEGTTRGYSVCMMNVGVKRICIHRNLQDAGESLPTRLKMQ